MELNLLLATKFHRSLTVGRLTERPRLDMRLDESLAAGCPLVLVTAPAGFGKSTLVSAWLARIEHRDVRIENADQGADHAACSMRTHGREPRPLAAGVKAVSATAMERSMIVRNGAATAARGGPALPSDEDASAGPPRRAMKKPHRLQWGGLQ